MSQVMLALVGDQPMPNIIAALQDWGAGRVTALTLVYSDKEYRDIAVRIQQVLGQAKFGVPCDLKALKPDASNRVDPYDIAGARDTCEALIKGLRDGGATEVLVNITGGTKPMALGAYLAAQARACPVVYVDADADRILRWTPVSGYRDPEVLNFRTAPLCVEDYLTAHAVQLRKGTQEKTETAVGSLAKWKAGIDYLARDCSKYSAELDRVRAVAANRFHNPCQNPTPNLPEFLDNLKQLGLIQSWAEEGTGVRIVGSAEQADLLKGAWLEYYVYDQTRRQNPLDVRVGMFLERKLQSPGQLGGGVDDEFDVLAVFGTRLVVAECKTGRMDERDQDGKKLEDGERTEPIVKLVANTNQLGLYCGRVIVVSRDLAPPGDKGGLTDDFVRRAIALDVAPVFGPHLKNVGEIMRNPAAFIRDLPRKYRR